MSEQISSDQLTADAEFLVMILRGAVVYAKEHHGGQGPPSITLGDASRAADMIETQASLIAELHRALGS
jgi:hypothetical protein